MSHSDNHEAVESLVTGVWCDVFQAARGDPDEDFFDLGGDSFLARRVTNTLSSLLGKRIPLAVLFDAPTLGTLIATVKHRLSTYDDYLNIMIPRLPRIDGP